MRINGDISVSMVATTLVENSSLFSLFFSLNILCNDNPCSTVKRNHESRLSLPKIELFIIRLTSFYIVDSLAPEIHRM